MMVLDIQGFADRAGLKPATIRQYKWLGKLPNPDVTVGGNPAWTVATVDHWIAERTNR